MPPSRLRLTVACLLAALLPTSALRLSAPTTRRSALGTLVGGAAVAALPIQSAPAANCLGKCVDEDAERRRAERIAIQTGSNVSSNEKFSNGVQGLIEKSIRNAEASNGRPLTDEEKDAIAVKVRALSPDTVVVCAAHTLLLPMCERCEPLHTKRFTEQRTWHACACAGNLPQEEGEGAVWHRAVSCHVLVVGQHTTVISCRIAVGRCCRSGPRALYGRCERMDAVRTAAGIWRQPVRVRAVASRGVRGSERVCGGP